MHYKSIGDLILTFSNITVLVGPNGVGKSNLIDALRFLRDCQTDGLDAAVHQRGGLNIIRQYAPTRPFSVTLHAIFAEVINENEYRNSYELRFSNVGDDVAIERETIAWTEDMRPWVRAKETKKPESHFFRRDAEGDLYLDDEHLSLRPPGDMPMLGSYAQTESSFLRLGEPIAGRLIASRFCSIYPNIMREPARLDTDRNLREDGSNWASIIRSMRRTKEGKEAMRRITELMQRVMPSLKRIDVKNIGGYLAPQFLTTDRRSGKDYFLDPVQLSDGTLRVFGMLLALYYSRRASLIAIEEPEQTVHPALLGILVDAFREASMQSQLVITTHSPHLLDYFEPSEIRVVYLHNGQTQVGNVNKTQVSGVVKRLMTMSEVMALDGLQPDL